MFSGDKYCSRQAIMVGDILTVTVKNTNFASDEYSDSVNLVDENNSFHDDDIVKDKAADVLDLPDKDDVQVCKTVLNFYLIITLHLVIKEQ
jgi:flagellar basal body L-ring protein FlgH